MVESDCDVVVVFLIYLLVFVVEQEGPVCQGIVGVVENQLDSYCMEDLQTDWIPLEFGMEPHTVDLQGCLMLKTSLENKGNLISNANSIMP